MYKVNDVTNWLSQTTDNSKYFVWSPGLWDKESRLYSLKPHCCTPGIYAEGYIVFVFPFVCSFIRDSVRFVELLQSFTLKFLKWGISQQPLIRKHSYLDHRYPGGWAFSPWLLTPGSMPQGGARGQNLDTFKKCFSTFLLWKELMQIVGQTWLNLVTRTCGSWSEGQHDLYFMVHWFCLISWRLFDVWTSNFGIMSQYDMTFDLKINVSHCDIYFMVQWFCLIAWRLFDIWIPYFGIMSQYGPMFDVKIFVGHLPIFHGPVILPYSLKTIWYMNTILWDYESVWPDVWPQNICRTLWPIFHGPVILPCILNTIQWLNFILFEYESVWPDFWPHNQCRSLWPIFHGPVIMPYSFKTISCMNIISWDYKCVTWRMISK